MGEKSETIQAIERLRKLLLPALCCAPPQDMQAVYKSAHEAITGIPAIDALLPYVDAEGDREIIEARLLFLARVQQAMQEPSGASGRGRKKMADAAGKNLRDAAQSLRELGSDGLALALEQLAGLVAERAHVSIIDVTHLSSGEIVPGTRLFAQHTPHQLSAYYPSQRGQSSHRADLIRFVCQRLQESTSSTLIANLFSGVLGITCTHNHVHQALHRQEESIRKSRASSGEADLNAALGKWRV